MFLYINATRCVPTSDYSDRLLERVLVFAERSPELVPNKIADGVLCLVPSGQQGQSVWHGYPHRLATVVQLLNSLMAVSGRTSPVIRH